MQVGNRIRLLHTTDPYTRLRPGDTGTVTRVSRVDSSPGPGDVIHVNWDTGSTLSLIGGADRWEVL